MYYRQASNQYIVEGMQFIINDITYPSSWLGSATAQDKQALGLEKVIVVGEFKDGKYYNNSEILSGATLTIASTAKPLSEVKEQAIKDVKAMVYSILLPTDWVEARNLRTPEYKLDWMLWRDGVRATGSSTETSINNALTVDAVATIMSNITWPNND